MRGILLRLIISCSTCAFSGFSLLYSTDTGLPLSIQPFRARIDSIALSLRTKRTNLQLAQKYSYFRQT